MSSLPNDIAFRLFISDKLSSSDCAQLYIGQTVDSNPRFNQVGKLRRILKVKSNCAFQQLPNDMNFFSGIMILSYQTFFKYVKVLGKSVL